MSLWIALTYLSVASVASVIVAVVLVQSEKPPTRDDMPPDAG